MADLILVGTFETTDGDRLHNAVVLVCKDAAEVRKVIQTGQVRIDTVFGAPVRREEENSPRLPGLSG